MTVTARSNAACEPGVRSSSAARSRSISSRTRARSIAADVVAMPRSVRPPAAAPRAVNPLPRRQRAPPAMAGRITSVSAPPTGVSRPSRTRTSSSFRYTLTYRLSPPSSLKSCDFVSGCASASALRTAPTFSPSADTSRSPPVDARRTGGILIVAMERVTLARRGAERLVVGEHAHLRVGDLARLARADPALGVAADLQLGRRRGQRVVHQQAADERLARADDELDDLGRLEQAHRAGQHAEHAVRAAGRGELGRRRLREQAAVARAVVRGEDAELALEAEDRGRDDRDLEADARVVEEVARREVVDAVDDDVPALDDLHDVRGVEARLVLDDVDVGVQRLDLLLGRVDLRDADAVGRVDDLALEVRDVDHVVVDDAQRAAAGRREGERRRGAEPARAEQQDLGVEELLLALLADLRQQEVARVALALLGRVRPRDLDGVAAVLPQRVAARHRLDALIAQLLLERLGGQRGAVARGAVEDHALGAIG